MNSSRSCGLGTPLRRCPRHVRSKPILTVTADMLDRPRRVRLDFSLYLRHDRGRDASYLAPTGSPEAVTRLRLPQNVACGFAALRSSAVGSQHSLLFVQVSFPWSAGLLFE